MLKRSHLVIGAVAVAVTALTGTAAGAACTASSSQPSLVILTPKSGAEVEGPLVVRYRVRFLKVGSARPAYLRVSLPGMERPVRSVVRVLTEAGTVTVPVSKLETGQRDLRFTLLRTNRVAADSVLVRDVLLTGGRN